MRKLMIAIATMAALAVALPSGAVPAPVGSVPVGAGPSAVAWNPVTRLFYVANSSENAVSLVAAAGSRLNAGAPAPGQASAGAEIARIPVGSAPAGLAVHPETGTVYVSNQGANSISAISASGLVQTGPVGAMPWGLAVDSATGKLCVAMFGDNKLWIIDSATMATSAVLSIPGGPNAVAAGGGRCYVTAFYAGTVTAVNLATPSIAWSALSVPGVIGSCPSSVALYPGLPAHMYVTNECSNSLSIINPINGGLLLGAPVPLAPGAAPAGVAASDSSVYVTERGLGRVSVLNPFTGTGVALPAGNSPRGVAVSDVPECALAANFSSQTASMICDVL
ncbi:MAG TPA: YncE family protein [Actinomycetota bacterium]|nr:YncE family protein [Actinomycetota bacterium]